MTGVSTSAHRLVLSGPEWMLLCRIAEISPPEGFGPEEDIPEDEVRGATGALVERGVLYADEQLHPSVAANLAVFASPAALVRTDVTLGEGGPRGPRALRAAHVVRGQLGCSLFALDNGGVELSMFPAVALGRELIRGVPDPLTLRHSTTDNTIHTALGGEPETVPPLRGRLPLAALADFGFLPPTGTGHLALTDDQAALAAQLTTQSAGVLHCLAVGTTGADADPGRTDTVLAGAVLWLLADAGWVGLRQRPDGSGRQMVDVVPVVREEIGTWLAPYLARILEGATG